MNSKTLTFVAAPCQLLRKISYALCAYSVTVLVSCESLSKAPSRKTLPLVRLLRRFLSIALSPFLFYRFRYLYFTAYVDWSTFCPSPQFSDIAFGKVKRKCSNIYRAFFFRQANVVKQQIVFIHVIRKAECQLEYW